MLLELGDGAGTVVGGEAEEDATDGRDWEEEAGFEPPSLAFDGGFVRRVDVAERCWEVEVVVAVDKVGLVRDG